MGKLEVAGLVAALAGIASVQSMEAPVEDRLIETTGSLMSMTHSEFETWCERNGATMTETLDDKGAGKVTCAWVEDGDGGEHAWHAALHFDGIHQTPVKADAGLVEASESTVIRLVNNEFGGHDMNTGEGFPVWEIELDGRPGRLTVAPFEDITLVRMAREDRPAVLSMR